MQEPDPPVQVHLSFYDLLMSRLSNMKSPRITLTKSNKAEDISPQRVKRVLEAWAHIALYHMSFEKRNVAEN